MAQDLNVILISLDAVRPDHLGCYGYARQTSPNIDALAEKGVLFEQAIAASYWTLPSHASIFSGLLPPRHGAIFPRNKISEKVKLWAEILREQKFITKALVGIFFVGTHFGFDRGFDDFSFQKKVCFEKKGAQIIMDFFYQRPTAVPSGMVQSGGLHIHLCWQSDKPGLRP